MSYLYFTLVSDLSIVGVYVSSNYPLHIILL